MCCTPWLAPDDTAIKVRDATAEFVPWLVEPVDWICPTQYSSADKYVAQGCAMIFIPVCKLVDTFGTDVVPVVVVITAADDAVLLPVDRYPTVEYVTPPAVSIDLTAATEKPLLHPCVTELELMLNEYEYPLVAPKDILVDPGIDSNRVEFVPVPCTKSPSDFVIAHEFAAAFDTELLPAVDVVNDVVAAIAKLNSWSNLLARIGAGVGAYIKYKLFCTIATDALTPFHPYDIYFCCGLPPALIPMVLLLPDNVTLLPPEK